MAGGFKSALKITGEDEYNKALKNIKENLKLLASEMKVVTSQYDKNDKSAENLTAQNKVLKREIKEQEEAVGTYKAALETARRETGESSDVTRDWQIKLNKAQADLNQMNRKLEENTRSMDQAESGTKEETSAVEDFGKEADKSGEKALSLGDIIKANLISDGIKSGLSALASGMKKLGDGMVSVIKSAVSGYSDYEQLVGGVETLFKSSSNKVVEYANNAYKTAGLSANDYMETVTSFSASLLQSLNGDTEKASEKSDMAITDMADNANKMGTAMSEIQHAYQGFAKQNYTMLDNLKLGYGGTKTEMERLLADAEKISGVKYDISSFADITDAIHVMQTEMGIAGTTQKEAAETIQGSISAMSSAWGNLLAGLGDGNANIGLLCNNLIDSVLTVADNVMPAVDSIVAAMPDVVNKLLKAVIDGLPKFVETGKEILTSLIKGISNNISTVTSAVMEIVNMLVNTVVTNLPAIIETGAQLLVSLVGGISESLPSLIPAVIDAVLLMAETILDNIDTIVDAGINMIMSLQNGLLEALPDFIDKVPIIIEKLVMALTNNLPKIIEMGVVMQIKLIAGLIKAIPQLLKAAGDIVVTLVKGIANYYHKMTDVGLNLVKGIWNGIKDATGWLMDKIKGFGKTVLDGIKKIFGIHSPSTLFRDEVGKNLALGLGEGFSGEMSRVTAEMQSAIPKKFDTSVNTSYTASGADTQFDVLVTAFKTALKDVKVIIDDREMGMFVTDTVGKAVYGY